MNRILTAFLIIIFTIGGVNSAVLPETINRSVELRNYTSAITELRSLRSTNERQFIENDLDYLLARLAESEGQFLTAMTEFRSVAGRRSDLRPFALMHLSQIARSTGNLALERIWLNELTMLEGDSAPARSAGLRLALNYFEGGNYGESISILSNAGTGESSSSDGSREIRGVLGDAYLRSGQAAKAREIFAKLIASMPNRNQPDDVALKAARGLDLIDVGVENYGKKAPVLPEAETLQRAGIYQFNREFAEAKLHFESLIASGPTSINAADAIFQIGRGSAQQGDYTEAIKWFERVLEQFPDSPAAKDSLLQAASAYVRVGRPKEAIKRYQSFIAKYPNDEKLDRAYLNPVDIFRDLGNDSDALKWCSNTEAAFKGKVPEALAVFAEARIHIAKENWAGALSALDRLKGLPDLGGAAAPGGTSPAEASFLRGFALENLKQYPEAIDVYLSIPDGRGEYYRWRATERLKVLANDEAGRGFISQRTGSFAESLKSKDAIIRRSSALGLLRLSDIKELRAKAIAVLKPIFSGLPALGVGGGDVSLAKSDPASKRLTDLGLYDEAIFANGNEQTGPAANLPAAKMFLRGGRADRAIAYIEPFWKKMPADIPLELIPREQLEMLYPAPFAGEMLRSTVGRNVDPRLLLAIMRQESRFQPDVRSNAAARGLMQFISSTAEKVAGELDIKSFSQDDLYHPNTAILFGSQYVAGLFNIFPGQSEAVVASYNGGDDNMKRWLSRSRSGSPDRYVPEIIFSQTKDYVYRVMANYRVYRFLYDERLQPR